MWPRDTVSGGGNPPMGVGSPNVCIATAGAPESRNVAPSHAQTRAARRHMTGQCRHAATAGGETPGTHCGAGLSLPLPKDLARALDALGVVAALPPGSSAPVVDMARSRARLRRGEPNREGIGDDGQIGF